MGKVSLLSTLDTPYSTKTFLFEVSGTFLW